MYLNTVFKYNVFKYCPALVATERSFRRLTCVMYSLVWGGTHFCLWRVLEHLASRVSVAGSLLSNQTILGRGGVCLSDRLLAGRPNWTIPPCSSGWWSSLRFPVRVQCLVFGRRYRRVGDSAERVHDDLVALPERLWAMGLEVNGSKCDLTILNDSGGFVQRAPSDKLGCF